MIDNDISIIFEDIQTFLNGSSWQNFCSSLSNNASDQKSSNSLIPSILAKVSDGTLQPSIIFKNNDISSLVDSFILNPDPKFFNIASYLLTDNKNCPSLPFFELLLQRSPQTMISLISRKDNKVFTQYVRILTRSYITKPNQIISDSLCKYQLSLVIRELFLAISNQDAINDKYSYNYESETNQFDTTNTVSLLYELWKANNKKNNLDKFYSSLKNESTVSFEFHLDNVINSILDFIQFGSDHQLFDYSIIFGDIFGRTSNQYFVAILLERMHRTKEPIFQAQLELIDREASRPLRDEMRKSDHFQRLHSNEAVSGGYKANISDNELLSLSTQFVQKGSIPQKIAQLHLFDKQTLVNSVGPTLRRLAPSSSAAKAMLDALEKKKMLPVVKDAANWVAVVATLRDTDSTMAQFAEAAGKAKMKDFAPRFFDSFNKALYLRHSDDARTFCEKIWESVISKLADLKEFTKIAVDFLNGRLNVQHRKSLSLLAVRCPVGELAESDIFDGKGELRIVSDLHEAAVIGCSFLTTSKKKIDKKTVYFHPLLVLRLRWRSLRGDYSGNLPWLPEFASLVDNDPLRFLLWECGEVTPSKSEKRCQILAKLGVTTSFQRLPSILHHLVSLESPSQAVVEALVPFLSSCPIEKVALPEKVNLSVLFQISSIVWSKAVLGHPAVLAALREKPPLFMAQALLMSFDSNAYNFVCFPIGFYALLANAGELIGEKPPVLNVVHSIVESVAREEEFEMPDFLPKYAKIALTAYLVRHNFELNRFYSSDDEELASFCLFFLVCFKKFDRCIELLNERPRIVSCLLERFDDGQPFVEGRCWTTALVEFAIHCAAAGVAFEGGEWARFVELVYQVEWPQSVCDDQNNFVLFGDYVRRIGGEVKV